ncbi:hypothetical protein [Rhodococcus spongiicola]|uniref:Uncharacterized protein n=1 Tax=Rhodococcus spongiicola TaxID=2487352 RepID=A0A438B5I1_9NOCA|nr:hypothetical protein [Rhodococcus spongiicola]RVW06160.1 hypothetical protein EF834_01485 [Rhodococcus spongiicola]
MTLSKLARAGVLAIGLSILGAGVANAEDAWPENGYDVTDSVLMPDQLEFWNPMVKATRVVSPYGRSAQIVCAKFRGVNVQCWQADSEGNPRELDNVPGMEFIGSFTAPPSPVYIYPGMIPSQ